MKSPTRDARHTCEKPVDRWDRHAKTDCPVCAFTVEANNARTARYIARKADLAGLVGRHELAASDAADEEPMVSIAHSLVAYNLRLCHAAQSSHGADV